MLIRFFDGLDEDEDGKPLYQKVEHRRIGITAEDVKNEKFDEFKLEASSYITDEDGNETKKMNKYYPGFMKTSKDNRTLGIDALDPEALIARARKEIERYIDVDIWNEEQERYQIEVAKLTNPVVALREGTEVSVAESDYVIDEVEEMDSTPEGDHRITLWLKEMAA
jgi:hypothetical protein